MKNKEQLFIKTTFFLLLLGIVAILVGGIYALKDNYYSKARYARMQWQFAKSKLDYALDSTAIKRLGLRDIWPGSEKTVPINLAEAKTVSVLLYHGVIEDPDWQPDGVNIGQADFEKHMFALKKAGYHTVTLGEFLEFLQGKKKLADKSVLITFDDSRKDSFYAADPILKTLGYSAVMYVITNRSLPEGGEPHTFHLSQTELEKMLDTGRWELGSHTQNAHDPIDIDMLGTQAPFLSNKKYFQGQKEWETDQQYLTRVQADLAASKNDLEKNLGTSISSIAFPFGDYGQNFHNTPDAKNVILEATRQKYVLAFRQAGSDEYPGNYPSEDNFLAKRINVDSAMSSEDLVLLLSSNEEKSIPFEDSFYRDGGWVSGWGDVQLKNNTLAVGPFPGDDSSLAFLLGTSLWKDYHLKVRLKVLKGDAFSVVVRYNNADNYASCDFSVEGSSLAARVDATEKTIAESWDKLRFSSEKEMQVDVIVKGNQATCVLDGKTLVQGTLPDRLNQGGIGFKTWGSQTLDNRLSVSQVRVDR